MILLFSEVKTSGFLILEYEQETNSNSKTTGKLSNENYKDKINEAFYNSDFTNMSQNLHLYQMQEAKLQNSKRKNSKRSKENFSKDKYSNNLSHSKINKLTQKDKRDILKNKDFNFDLGQEFLESRYVAYQSKDLKYSLKNAKQIEKSLMQIKLDDSEGIHIKII